MAATVHNLQPATPRTVSPIDEHVGREVRKARRRQGMTLDELARALELSYQQVHKYENGTNRISAGTLWQIAQVLAVPIASLFPDEDEPPAETQKQKIERLAAELNAAIRGGGAS